MCIWNIKISFLYALILNKMKLVLSLAILLVLSSCASFLEEQQPMMENKIYKIKLDRTES